MFVNFMIIKLMIKLLIKSISCQATSCLGNLSKFVFHSYVRQFYAWTFGPSISCLSFSAPPYFCVI